MKKNKEVNLIVNKTDGWEERFTKVICEMYLEHRRTYITQREEILP